MTHTMLYALQVFSMLLSLAMLILAIYKRQAHRSLYFAFVVLAIFLFNHGYLVEISATTMEISILGIQLKYLGVPFIAPFVLLFVLDYCGAKTLSKLKTIALFAIPVVQCLLAFTYPWNGFYYTDITYVANAPGPSWEMHGSTFYYVAFIYAYILTICAVVIAVYFHRKGDTLHKKHSFIIIIATAIPGIGNAINVLGARLLPFDITSIMLSGTCTLLAYSLLRQGLFQVVPIAREQIVETMHDAFVLVDPYEKFIDANAAAKKLFPPLALASIGAPMGDITGIPWTAEQAGAETWSFSLQNESGILRHYSISKTIVSYQNKVVCNCLMIYDVTESKTLLDEVIELAEHDALTGLLNRGTFFKKGEQIFRTNASQKNSMSVLMMDLDHFKKLNDTFGHLAGDKVLVAVTQKLAAEFRDIDLFARYGGEEFCAFLPGIDEPGAMKIAQKLCELVKNIVLGAEMTDLHVTLSIGVAGYDTARHYTLDSFVQSADKALYDAKKTGRNKACGYLQREMDN